MVDRIAGAGRALTFRRQLLLVFGVLLAIVVFAAVLVLGRLGTIDEARERVETRTAAIEAALGENRDLREAYEADLKEATADANEDLERSLTSVESDTRAARIALLVALLVLAAAALASALWIELRTRARLTPLVARLRSLDEHCVADLDRGLGAMAHGDLTVEAVPVTEPPPPSARDQIGEASETTNALIGKMQASVAGYNGMREQLGGLIGEIAGSSRALSSASQQMAGTSNEAGRAVGEIASAVGEVAQGADRQVRMVEETRAAVQEAARAAAASGETAKATAQAAENARRAAHVAEIAADAERAEGSVAEVTSVAEQSSASAEQVSAATQQTTASTQEIAASAQSLAGTAKQLDELVRRFKVGAAI